MRLGIKDHKVIRAFVDRTSLEGNKLSTDGKRLDGHWLGGSRIADWQSGEIVFHDLGSRAAQSVQKQVRYHAAPNMLQETRVATKSARRSSKRTKAKRSTGVKRRTLTRLRRVRVGTARRGFGVMRSLHSPERSRPLPVGPVRRARWEVIESLRWVNTKDGRTASPYGSIPWTNKAEESDWQLQKVGWTVRDNNTGTVGVGRQPWPTRGEAQEAADKMNSR